MRRRGALLVLAAVLTGCGAPARSLAPPAKEGPVNWNDILKGTPDNGLHTLPPRGPVPTAFPTQPPVTGAQLEAFNKDGTIPPGWVDSEGSRLVLGVMARAAQGAALDSCIAQAVTLADLEAADLHDLTGTGDVTHAVLHDRTVACWRANRAAWFP